MQILYPADKQEWLQLRTQDVTSTEVSALFGCNPYMSAFELHHAKANGLTGEFEPSERMKWGNRLESAIALGVAQDLELKIRKFSAYIRDEQLRMAASFDYEIIGHDDGPGILEIKLVDRLVYMRDWLPDEAPPHIEMQVQQQLAVTGRNWAIIAALVGGNELVTIRREANPDIQDAMRKKVAKFWADVAAGNMPEPNYDVDAKLIIGLYNQASDSVFDAQGNAEIAALAAAYSAAGKDEAAAKARKDEAKAKILEQIKDAGKVIGDGFTISAGMTQRASYVVDACEFRNFRINFKKPKGE